MPKRSSVKKAKPTKRKRVAKPRISKKGKGLFHSLPYKSELAARAHMYGSGFIRDMVDGLVKEVKSRINQ